ncbi:MAG: FAD-dependent oxidoreductase [Oscillospiraceae bacterium]|nr:FAD-dependent oxidoreductase [Oscillospiraceae bacterium]
MKETKKIFHRLLALTLAAGLCLSASGCGKKEAEEDGVYTAGEYTASAQGMGGQVPVTVTFSANEITKVEIGEHNETPGISDPAIEQLPDAIVKAQSADVDVVSGATVTSTAIIEAVKSCIAQAKGEEVGGGADGYTAGTYTATVTGMGGPFELSVTFSDDAITDIRAGENEETIMVGTEAIRILGERIIASQSLGVDTLTGATITSMAVLSGVKDCVNKAGGDVAALQVVSAPVETYEGKTREADIIVVGGGLAGITTAISAAVNGGNVILLEKKAYLGGNSVLSTGTFILGGTSVQAGLDIQDDPDTFYNWEIAAGEGKKDPEKVAMVAYHSQDLIDFFSSLGVNFNTEKVNSTDGSEINRGHALSPNIGTGVATLVSQLANNGVDVRFETDVNGLITDDSGAVIGVTATNAAGEAEEYYGKQIVLASGGFGDNNDMIVKYWGEEYDGLVYGGSKGMDGTMMRAAMDLGAATVDMEDAHIDATLEVTRGVTITTNLLRNCSSILVRQSTGERFADEQSSHSEIAAAAMHDLGDPYYYEICNSDMFTYSEAVAAKAKSYVAMGLTTQYDTVEDMAAGIGVDAGTLQKTIDDFNAAVRGEVADPFGRERFGATELAAPFYVLKVSNGVACTTGGLKTNNNFQVLDEEGNAIEGLYAAGEMTGGSRVHYIGGDALSNASVGGMLLGQQLAEMNK